MIVLLWKRPSSQCQISKIRNVETREKRHTISFILMAASSRSRWRQDLHISAIDDSVTPQSRKANFWRLWPWFSSNCVIKVSPTTTFRSGSLMMNDVNGGDENLILARRAERMAGEGDGDVRYLASIARFLKLRSGAGGKTSGRVFS